MLSKHESLFSKYLESLFQHNVFKCQPVFQLEGIGDGITAGGGGAQLKPDYLYPDGFIYKNAPFILKLEVTV